MGILLVHIVAVVIDGKDIGLTFGPIENDLSNVSVTDVDLVYG